MNYGATTSPLESPAPTNVADPKTGEGTYLLKEGISSTTFSNLVKYSKSMKYFTFDEKDGKIEYKGMSLPRLSPILPDKAFGPQDDYTFPTWTNGGGAYNSSHFAKVLHWLLINGQAHDLSEELESNYIEYIKFSLDFSSWVSMWASSMSDFYLSAVLETGQQILKMKSIDSDDRSDIREAMAELKASKVRPYGSPPYRPIETSFVTGFRSLLKQL